MAKVTVSIEIEGSLDVVLQEGERFITFVREHFDAATICGTQLEYDDDAGRHPYPWNRGAPDGLDLVGRRSAGWPALARSGRPDPSEAAFWRAVMNTRARAAPLCLGGNLVRTSRRG